MCINIRKKLKKTVKAVFTVLFAAVLLISSQSAPVKVEASVESELSEKQKELKELENLLAAAKIEKSKLLDSLKKTEGKLNSLLLQKSTLEASIGYSEAEIELIDNLVEGYSSHLSELEDNLKTTEKLKEEKINQLCLVLKYIYENKEVSSLELFFSSENFSQFISKKEHAKSILYYQETIISEIEQTEIDYEKTREDYQRARASLDGYKKTLEEKRLSVDDEYEELEKVIFEVQNTLQLQEEDYNAINDIEKGYASEIGQVKIDIEELSEYLSDKFRWPLYQNQSYYISSYFGNRNGPFAGKEHHNGVDIVVPKGTSILASAGGVVTRSEYAPVFGNVVVITHGNGLQTLYCHCNKRLVSVGDKVKQGDVIAKVGSTGNSTGPHLHFAFILNGSYVNPEKYISKDYF